MLDRLVRMRDRHIDECLISRQFRGSEEELFSSFSDSLPRGRRGSRTYIQVHHIIDDDLEVGAGRIPATSASNGPVEPVHEDIRKPFYYLSCRPVVWVSTPLFLVSALVFPMRSFGKCAHIINSSTNGKLMNPTSCPTEFLTNKLVKSVDHTCPRLTQST